MVDILTAVAGPTFAAGLESARASILRQLLHLLSARPERPRGEPLCSSLRAHPAVPCTRPLYHTSLCMNPPRLRAYSADIRTYTLNGLPRRRMSRCEFPHADRARAGAFKGLNEPCQSSDSVTPPLPTAVPIALHARRDARRYLDIQLAACTSTALALGCDLVVLRDGFGGRRGSCGMVARAESEAA